MAQHQIHNPQITNHRNITMTQKRIAAITMARNDEFFLSRWIEYYGKLFGNENLYIILDGLDQVVPKNAGTANITKLPHTDMSRAAGDKYRINLISDRANELLKQLPNQFDVSIIDLLNQIKANLANMKDDEESLLNLAKYNDLNSQYEEYLANCVFILSPKVCILKPAASASLSNLLNSVLRWFKVTWSQDSACAFNSSI